MGENVLYYDWTGDNAWANPPFQLMGGVVHNIIQSGASVTLFAPVWRAQPWWQRAMDHCTEWVRLAPVHGVYTHGSRSTPAPRPLWRTVVFCFAGTTPCGKTRSAGSS